MSITVLEQAIKARDDAKEMISRCAGEITGIERNIEALMAQATEQYGVSTVPELEALHARLTNEFNVDIEKLRKVLNDARA